MFERPGRPADRFPPPVPERQAAAAANGGTAPPDLSLIAKARTYERGFPCFVFDLLHPVSAEQGRTTSTPLLNGYEEPPDGVTVPTAAYYNTYFPGHVIAMPKPLSDGQVNIRRATTASRSCRRRSTQYSQDVSAFLMWAAEPHLEARKRLGFQVMLFLIVLSRPASYFVKKKVWAGAHVWGDFALACAGLRQTYWRVAGEYPSWTDPYARGP